MSSTLTRDIFLGTDSGATTSKTGGVFADGSPISLKLRQSSTNSQLGTAAVVSGWVEGAVGFLADNNLSWDRVAAVGLALPGPYQRYGVLDKSANLPESFAGWDFHADYSAALARAAGRPIPLHVGNDGDLGGVGEAARVRGTTKASVLLLAPGSGLGAAFIDPNGLPLSGDHFAGMEAGHMPVPLHLLGAGLDKVPPFSCGCGRTWGCIEAYSTISGLPQYIAHLLPKYPNHDLVSSTDTPKQKALSLRGRAQKGDALALEIFDLQARALGLHVANLAMALDPGIVVIGGGLIDPESTTQEFRDRYLNGIRDAARPYLWPKQREKLKIVPATLGELSQSIGAALLALYSK
ncbi:MAG: ROK family protein [Verrucomicrobia bacterium]|nr:MAG: ROK family protein [Verrucomicrobiota bacterium]